MTPACIVCLVGMAALGAWAIREIRRDDRRWLQERDARRRRAAVDAVIATTPDVAEQLAICHRLFGKAGGELLRDARAGRGWR